VGGLTAVALRAAAPADRPAIERLLVDAGLPVEGVEESLAHFCVAEANGELVGVGGYEPGIEEVGLLRSLAVRPDCRRRGIARQLVERVVAQARRLGVTELYLLTTDAQGYFARLGFAAVERNAAPAAIRATTQFRELCPDSATLMFRALR
jgi:N-acetylglutamate synthase-like GNAT family acetyltransferase